MSLSISSWVLALFLAANAFGQGQRLPAALFAQPRVGSEFGYSVPTADERIRKIRFSADGRKVYFIGDSVFVFDRETGACHPHFTSGGLDLFSLPRFSADGQSVVAKTGSGISIRSVDDRAQVTDILLPEKYRPSSFEISPDRRWLALGLEARVAIYDLEQRKVVLEAQQGKQRICEVRFSADGKKLAAVEWARGDASTGSMVSYDLGDEMSGRLLAHEGSDDHFNGTLQFSPDGSKVFGFSEKVNRFKAWDAKTGDELWVAKRSSVNNATLSPDGRVVAVGGHEAVTLLSTESGEVVRTISGLGRNQHVYGLAFSPDGRSLAVGVEDQLRFFDPHTGEPQDFVAGHQAPVSEMEMTSDGERLLSCDTSSQVILWDVGKREIVWQISMGESAKEVYQATIHEASQRAILTTRRYRGGDSSFHILDLKTGERLFSLDAHKAQTGNALITADGRFIYTGSAEAICRWSMETGELLKEIPIVIPLSQAHYTPSYVGIEFPLRSEGAIWWTDDWTRSVLFSLEDGKQLAEQEQYAKERVGIENAWLTASDIEIFPARSLPWPDFNNESLERGEILRGRFQPEQIYPFGRLFLLRSHGECHLMDGVTHSRIWKVPYSGKALCACFTPDGESIVVGGTAGLEVFPVVRATDQYKSQPLDNVWLLMGHKNGAEAWAAALQLISRPEARDFLIERLRPVAEVSAEQVTHFREMLNDESVEVHEIALRSLNDLGVAVSDKDREPAAVYPVVNKDGPFFSGRTPDLLRKDEPWPKSNSRKPPLKPLSARARSSRAIVILSKIGGPEAIAHLQKLAAGHPDHPQTIDAKVALLRLGRR